MKKIILILVGALLTLNLTAQKFWTQSANIEFHSDAALEKIEATNNQVSCVLDMETGELAFSLLMKAFLFEKALMQEHFNEKYVESDKFPKASFKGKIVDFDKLDKSKSGAQKVMVTGTLTIHGVSQEIKTEGELSFVNAKNVKANSTFNIELSDYDIKIPSVVKDNIAKTIQIVIDANLVPYEK